MTPIGRIAGVDFGTKRIGIAITDADRRLASPLTGYDRRDAASDARWFQQLASREEIVLFVVGLPLHGSGDESAKSQEAHTFGAWLQQTTGVPVEFFDERYSTVQADHWLAEGKLTKQRRQRRRDMLAAQVILSAYLESQNRDAPPGPLADDTD